MICGVQCLNVSVTNTKANATLATEHILFWLFTVVFLFSFVVNEISVIRLNVIFVNSVT